MSEEFIDLSGVDLTETYPPTVAEAGSEKKLRIVSFMKDKDKNQKDYIMPFYEIIDDPYSKEFGDYMALPSSEMSPKELNNAKLRLKAFSEAFGIDLTSGTLDVKNDIVGKEGWAILGTGKDQNDEQINRVRRYVTGA
jgi:hypothetical protein